MKQVMFGWCLVACSKMFNVNSGKLVLTAFGRLWWLFCMILSECETKISSNTLAGLFIRL